MARKSNNTVHITLRLPRPILTQIDAIAYENLHSRNQELVRLLIRALENATTGKVVSPYKGLLP